MLEHLGGLWDVHLLADVDTLQLLNKMAGGVRKRTNESETIEETFELRSAPVRDWTDLVARRKQRRSLPRLELADFTKRNVIRLGLETKCSYCHFTNWHSLTVVDYSVTCDRCLNPYDFPEARLRDQNRNWHYRVVGPFSVPDYGRGAYSVLLALRVFDGLIGIHGEMTFSTAMNLRFDDVDTEVDFVAWWRKESHTVDSPPQLIVGEAKSLGRSDLIKSDSLTKLKSIGRKLPGAIIVISVLCETFLSSEIELLEPFVKWGRRINDEGQPTNPVILLTANELFSEHHISATWEELGDPHKNFTDFHHTRNLLNFADATQRIYLGITSFHEWQEAEWRKRAARRK